MKECTWSATMLRWVVCVKVTWQDSRFPSRTLPPLAFCGIRQHVLAFAPHEHQWGPKKTCSLEKLWLSYLAITIWIIFSVTKLQRAMYCVVCHNAVANEQCSAASAHRKERKTHYPVLFLKMVYWFQQVSPFDFSANLICDTCEHKSTFSLESSSGKILHLKGKFLQNWLSGSLFLFFFFFYPFFFLSEIYHLDYLQWYSTYSTKPNSFRHLGVLCCFRHSSLWSHEGVPQLLFQKFVLGVRFVFSVYSNIYRHWCKMGGSP